MAFTDEQNEQIRNDLIREAQRCGITIGMRKDGRLAAQGRYGAGCRHSAGLDFNHLPSGADWGALPTGAGNAGAGRLPGAICISGKAAVMRLFKRDTVSLL